MRRYLSLLAATATVLAGLTAVSGLPAANAAGPITGKLVDGTTTALAPAPNMEVRLQQVTSSGAGAVVATDITAADRSFSLATGSDD